MSTFRFLIKSILAIKVLALAFILLFVCSTNVWALNKVKNWVIAQQEFATQYPQHDAVIIKDSSAMMTHVILPNAEEGGLIYENDNYGTFVQKSNRLIGPTNGGIYRTTLVDFDGDGVSSDIVALNRPRTNQKTFAMYLFKNTSYGEWATGLVIAELPEYPYAIDTFELPGAKVGVAVLYGVQHKAVTAKLRIYELSPNSKALLLAEYKVPGAEHLKSYDWTDDGVGDIIFTSQLSGKSCSQSSDCSYLGLLMFDGKFKLDPIVREFPNEELESIAIGDMTNDGTPDVVVEGNFKTYAYEIGGKTQMRQLHLAIDDYGSISLGDANQDGLIDILSPGYAWFSMHTGYIYYQDQGFQFEKDEFPACYIPSGSNDYCSNFGSLETMCGKISIMPNVTGCVTFEMGDASGMDFSVSLGTLD